ncbi:MAG: hypothetical protein L6R40_008194 [Gallowayella cf. fulva]|nr:MAG: hypothetical protein L6R40_008194 [Xanthomendoza cf. fulva]
MMNSQDQEKLQGQESLEEAQQSNIATAKDILADMDPTYAELVSSRKQLRSFIDLLLERATEMESHTPHGTTKSAKAFDEVGPVLKQIGRSLRAWDVALAFQAMEKLPKTAGNGGLVQAFGDWTVSR